MLEVEGPSVFCHALLLQEKQGVKLLAAKFSQSHFFPNLLFSTPLS
jgi:hypothetical protein